MAKPEDGLGLLIGIGGKPKASKHAEPEGDEGDVRTLAAKALISAVKSGDAQGVLDAMDELTAPPPAGDSDGDEMLA